VTYVRDVLKDHKFLISKKRSVATRKFYSTCFSEGMLLLDKKGLTVQLGKF